MIVINFNTEGFVGHCQSLNNAHIFSLDKSEHNPKFIATKRLLSPAETSLDSLVNC